MPCNYGEIKSVSWEEIAELVAQTVLGKSNNEKGYRIEEQKDEFGWMDGSEYNGRRESSCSTYLLTA